MDFLESYLKKFNKEKPSVLNNPKIIIVLLFAMATRNFDLWNSIYDVDVEDEESVKLYEFKSVNAAKQLDSMKLLLEMTSKGVFGHSTQDVVIPSSLAEAMEQFHEMKPEADISDYAEALGKVIDKRLETE